MGTTAHEAIRLENINYSVNGLHILKDITGWFILGDITTLVGPSGSGKTTLFQLCNGMKTPSSGDISIMGEEISSYNPVELRRNVGIALQQATMVTGNVKKNLELPLELQNKVLTDKDATELLHIVGLEDVRLDQDSKDLSGGQRQKLSIARTLVNKPKILLLDEITSSLDRVSEQDIEKLIVKLNKNYKTTIIWITHSLEQALRVGDYAWVMMDGRIMETGEVDLLRSPKSDKVKGFVEGGTE